MNTRRFRNMFAILHNIDLDELEKAGVVTPGAVGGSDWSRFNKDVGLFVLKLPTDRLEKLFALIESRQPKREPDPDRLLEDLKERQRLDLEDAHRDLEEDEMPGGFN